MSEPADIRTHLSSVDIQVTNTGGAGNVEGNRVSRLTNRYHAWLESGKLLLMGVG